MQNTAVAQRPMEMGALTQNEFSKSRTASTEIVSTQKMQEIQAQVIIANRFPRDEYEAFNRVMSACQRKSLAEAAIYSYPRGGSSVTGPSIRLAEAIAQNWGNINFGVIELERRSGESQAMAYAWDLQTNTRVEKIFTVRHIRDTRGGGYALKDERDIYELVANNGARRLRACVLSVIPGDLTEKAVKECHETMKRADKDKPLSERLEAMLSTFVEKFNVTKDDIEKFIGYKVQKMTEDDLMKLRGVYQSLKDGQAKREDFFDLTGKPAQQPSENAPPDEPSDDGQPLSMSDL